MVLKLVIDANVLFSALLANGMTRSLIFNPNLKLYSPEYLLGELNENLETDEELREKLRQTSEETRVVIQELRNNIEIIPLNDYAPFIKQAIEISPDELDAPYFALALKMKIPLWSNERKLKRQQQVKVVNTQELVELLF